MKLEQLRSFRPDFYTLAARVFWLGLIAAFVGVSAPKILRKAGKNAIYFAGPFHSTDSFLHLDTGEINGSEHLLALFAKIPASQKIVIFTRDDDRRSSFIGTLVAYLAWPHPVRLVDVTQAEWGTKNAESDLESVGAFVLCRVTPPAWWTRGERFGETLEVFPAANVAQR